MKKENTKAIQCRGSSDGTLYMLDTKGYPEVESVYNEALKCILTTMI